MSLATHPLHVAVETEDVEHPVCVDLRGLQAVHHDNGGVRVGAVLRGRGAVSRPKTLASTTAPHGGPHAASLVVRGGPVALVVVAMIASLRATLCEDNRANGRLR